MRSSRADFQFHEQNKKMDPQKHKQSRCKPNLKLFHIGLFFFLTGAAVFFTLAYEASPIEYLKLGILLSNDDGSDSFEDIQEELKHSKMHFQTIFKLHSDSDSLLKNFKSSKEAGTDHFITSASRSELRALCDSFNHTSDNPRIWSYQSPTSNCHSIVRVLDAPIEAHLVVLVDRILHAAVERVIVILDEDHLFQKTFIIDAFNNGNIEIVFITTVSAGGALDQHLKENLVNYPHVPLLATSGSSLFAVIRLVKDASLLEKRMIFSYIDPRDMINIFRNNIDRKIAEKLLVFTTANRLKPNTGNLPAHPQHVTKNEESVIVRKAFRFLTDSFNFNYHPKNIVNEDLSERVYDIELLRFVPEQMRAYVIQNHQLFLEQLVKVSIYNDRRSWAIRNIQHSTFKIFTDYELLQISRNENCEARQINISATENYRFNRVSVSYNISNIPSIILIPNSNPDGFIIKIQCGSLEENEILELGCLGASHFNHSAQCLAAKNIAHRRRITRSYTTNHIIPYERKDKMTNSNDMKNMMKINRMTGIVPQIAGCVGASGGCSLCFIYLQFIVPDGNPGVCFGACAVGIGGACSSFVAVGIHRSQDFTVICSELFYQGHIDLTSYMADARFGSSLSRKNPLALKGYQLAATPLVYLMRKSPKISQLIYRFALPWIHHMEYEVQLRDTDNTIGYLITQFGIPVCSIFGFCATNSYTLIPLLISYIIIRKTYR